MQVAWFTFVAYLHPWHIKICYNLHTISKASWTNANCNAWMLQIGIVSKKKGNKRWHNFSTWCQFQFFAFTTMWLYCSFSLKWSHVIIVRYRRLKFKMLMPPIVFLASSRIVHAFYKLCHSWSQWFFSHSS